MYDIKWIRQAPHAFDQGLARRGLAPLSGEILALDAAHRALQTEWQQGQARRNEVSKAIGAAKAKGDHAAVESLMAEVAALKRRLPELEAAARVEAARLDDLLAGLPNAPAEDVPDGADDSANVVLREEGARPAFAFPPRAHDELGPPLGMDFETAAAMSGARFTVLKGPLARLSRALGHYMLDLHTAAHGYVEVAPPVLVKGETLFGTGQLPKFADDLFRTTADHWLIPTAEVPLVNLVRERIVDEARLPLRFTALTPCFRSEAGAAGRDTRGMIRQHQFDKVELVAITAPEQAADEHARMTAAAEAVLKGLGLAYRVVLLSAGDMGFAARKTYDLEVWLPGQNRYREISSISDCGDFQARRMNARCRRQGARETRSPHTLNGSGVAVGRALIAVLETYQDAGGAVRVPDALKPYMGGLERLEPGA
ncbi:MAG: serine--tRNA ligase [Alphaproteobacteria bacterium]|nr:MAG: serine--tRNA ligase [Alphaproteobacteria bacterium]